MTKRNPKAKSLSQPPVPTQSKNPFAQNANFNQQTRKVLSKHYRAKFGVK